MFKNLKRNLAYWIEESIEPTIGSVVFCKLAGNAEHTGIFIGYLGEYDKCIVELGGDGEIRLVTPQEFLKGPSGQRLSGIAIYSSCDEYGNPIGDYQVADRAKRKINARRDYHLVVDNCHQFSCGCLSKDFENSNNFFEMIEEQVKKHINNGADITWRNWEFEESTSKILEEKSREEASEKSTEKYYDDIKSIENNQSLSFDEEYKLKTEIRKKQLEKSMAEYRENQKKMRNLFG